MQRDIVIIGGGLAGVETADMLIRAKIPVTLLDMKPFKKSPAHKNDNFAELVCSNSLRAKDPSASAVGILQREMTELDTLVMKSAIKNEVPAGGALAVNRELFSADITSALKNNPLFQFESREITELPQDKDKIYIIATGPLTSDKLAESIRERTGEDNLHFFDALAPIIDGESIDYSKAWFQSRYDKGNADDYLNCALTKEEYYDFVESLLNAEKTEFKDFEKDTPYFEGCLPVEVMAERGIETLAHGPLKPIGLTDPNSDKKPYAVIQLRKENKEGTMYNMVGFQTKMKHGAQIETFRKIPALRNATFARMGAIHRNTFINSAELLNADFSLKGADNIFFAGQIAGCEGYIESASMGALTGIIVAGKIKEKELRMPPPTTAMGAMYNHIVGKDKTGRFEPMNINFGLFKEIENHKIKGRNRKLFYSERARQDFETWLKQEATKIF